MSDWQSYVRRVVPYTPGEQPRGGKIIKLNTNENPYPPAPGVEKAIKEMDADALRLYPDPTCSELIQAIAAYYGIGEDEVFVGVGSDDVLAMIFMTFFNSKKPVIFPDITYSFYDVWASMLRIPYETVPLDSDFKIRPSDYKRQNGGIVFPNPNAPTGLLLSGDAVEQIVRDNPDVIVVVDEAYIDFGGTSALPLIKKYNNLIVVQTFSKSRSLAGMRIGFAMADPALIRYLNDVKYSYNSYTMNRTALMAGVSAIEDDKYFRETTVKIIETREWTKEKLSELGFTFGDSKSNFIFASHKKVPARTIFETLRSENIFVRYFDKPRIDNYLRISIGTDDEMKELVRVLERHLQ